MRYVFVLIILIAGVHESFCQDLGDEFAHCRVYKNLRKALKHHDEVEILDLSFKKLTSLPGEINRFKNLKVLKLNGNRIKELPATISELEYLEVIFYNKNELDSFPSNLTSIKSLRRLHISKNNLGSVPQEITHLENLKVLDLSFNHLKETDVDFIRKQLPDCLVVVDLKL